MSERHPAVVYFEHQKNDRMCGLHTLNSLLQGPVYSESILRDIALSIDEKEAKIIKDANNGRRESAHAAWDGFFSVQVIIVALESNSYTCTPFLNPNAEMSRQHPEIEDGFLCNHSEHWFGVRRIGNKWYRLNSLKSFPEEVSQDSVASLLKSMQLSGYSIFIIRHKNYPNQRLPDPRPDLQPEKRTGSLKDFEGPGKGEYLTPGDIETLKTKAEQASKANNNAAEGASSAAGTAYDFRGPRNTGPYVFPPSRGQALDNTTATPSNVATQLDDDPTLTAVLMESILSYKQSLPPPPAEDPSGVSITIVNPGGKYVRKFPKQASLLNIFEWLFWDPEVLPSLSSPLGTKETVTLTANFPMRTYICRTNGRISVVDGNGILMTEVPIASEFPHGERLNLYFKD